MCSCKNFIQHIVDDSGSREGSNASGTFINVTPPNSSIGNGGGSGTLDDVQSDNNNEESGGESYIMSFEYTRVTKRI